VQLNLCTVREAPLHYNFYCLTYCEALRIYCINVIRCKHDSAVHSVKDDLAFYGNLRKSSRPIRQTQIPEPIVMKCCRINYVCDLS
jgi:hypothetical protein